MKHKRYVVKDAMIAFRNFSGKPDRFNPEGNRNFCLILTESEGAEMGALGYNIKYLKPREEGESPIPYVNVTVRWGAYPPKIQIVRGENKFFLDESTVNILDWEDIECANVVIRPYEWSVGGKHGVKAYLKSMSVKVEDDIDFEDPF